MLIIIPTLQVVIGTIVGAGRVVVDTHPPHGAVGEELKDVGAAGGGLLHHGALVGVDGPVPARRRRVGAGVVDPVAVHLPRGDHVGRHHHGLAVDAVGAAGPGVIAYNIEAQAGDARAVVRDRVGREENVGQVVARAKGARPPGQRGAPALPGAPVGAGADGGRGVGSGQHGLAGQDGERSQAEGRHFFTLGKDEPVAVSYWVVLGT